MELYHGSVSRKFVPQYGLGEEKHDYGRGFYLTGDIELAKEWAVCNPNSTNGWVHKYTLDCDGLRILNLEENGILPWIAELMKHRDADSSKRYRILAKRFIEKYGVDTENYDVIKGWRANASYFYITKAFVRDEVDLDILEELFRLGDLGIQYCVKSEAAFLKLKEDAAGLMEVDYNEFNQHYIDRDIRARVKMKELIDSDRNKVEKVFSTLI